MKKAASYIFTLLFGLLSGAYGMAKICEKVLIKENNRANKNGDNFRTVCKWMKAGQSHNYIEDYFVKRDIKEIAVYGLGELGLCLMRELKETNISIKFIIDRDKNKWCDSCPLFSVEEDLPGVETIVVTPISEYEEISRQLRDKTDARIVSLKEIIDSL